MVLYAVFTDFGSYDEYLDTVHVDYQTALFSARELASTSLGIISIVQFASGSRPQSGREVLELPVTFDSEEDYS